LASHRRRAHRWRADRAAPRIRPQRPDRVDDPRFDVVDFSSSRAGDKFAKSGFTRGQASRLNAPTVNEAPIQLECRLSHTLRVPPMRTVFIAEVVSTTVHVGVCDEDGRLRPESAAFFGMAAGCGEFFTLGQNVGHIGESAARRDIRY